MQTNIHTLKYFKKRFKCRKHIQTNKKIYSNLINSMKIPSHSHKHTHTHINIKKHTYTNSYTHTHTHTHSNTHRHKEKHKLGQVQGAQGNVPTEKDYQRDS